MVPEGEIERIAAAALAEDGPLDLTTELTGSSRIQTQGIIEHRSGGVLAGTAFADAVAERSGCSIEWMVDEGGSVAPGSAVGIILGELGSVLLVERPMLNLLQRASGIATMTHRYVEAVQGTRCRILHTRKTAPGLRALDIAAVIAGGGWPHRADLGHEVMVKDNHWRALAQQGARLEGALAQARARHVTELYVEVESVEQLELACRAGATRLLVDNQLPAVVREWAGRARVLVPGIEIEATGGITLENVRAYAEAGADYVSIGALTHSVAAADISLEVDFGKVGSRR